MLFDFYHDVVDIYEFVFDWPVLEGWLRHDFLEPVIELDELGERRLQNLCSGFEVGKAPHDVAVDVIDGFLPVGIKPANQLTDLSYQIK